MQIPEVIRYATGRLKTAGANGRRSDWRRRRTRIGYRDGAKEPTVAESQARASYELKIRVFFRSQPGTAVALHAGSCARSPDWQADKHPPQRVGGVDASRSPRYAAVSFCMVRRST